MGCHVLVKQLTSIAAIRDVYNSPDILEPKWLQLFVVRSLVCDDVLFVLDVFPAFVNPYAIVFLFPPVPAILEAIIFEIMRCSKHPSKHPNIQACSKHPSTHPNIHPSISMHRSIQTSKQSSQFTNSTPQPTRQRNEASLKGAPRRILILNSPKPFKIMRLLKGISRSYAAVFCLYFCVHFLTGHSIVNRIDIHCTRRPAESKHTVCIKLIYSGLVNLC